MHIGCSGGLMEQSLLLLDVAPVIRAIPNVTFRGRFPRERVIAGHEDTHITTFPQTTHAPSRRSGAGNTNFCIGANVSPVNGLVRVGSVLTRGRRGT